MAVVVGVLLRLHSASALWLDEAQSVAIARQPLPDLLHALRQDGSPPLYYFLLHYWIAVFGTGSAAVRGLSVVLSVLAVAIAYPAGRAVAGPRAGAFAVVIMASSPFAIRYATEARMYALVSLLTMLAIVVFARADRRPSLANLLGVAAVSGLLALTHYWAFFVLACVALVLAVRAVRGPASREARRVLAAMACGGVLFIPWLPSFRFQMRHTGTPWAGTPSWATPFTAIRSWGGVGRHIDAAEPIYVLVIGLTLVALFARVDPDGRVALARPRDTRALTLFLAGVGSLVLGVAISRLTNAGVAPRYSAAALPPMVVLVALGATRLPRRAAATAVALAVTLGLATSIDAPFTTFRTQAIVTAPILRANLASHDLVVYCPDQVGPAVSRLLPPGVAQASYPTLQADTRVNWVDYGARNAAADPIALAAVIDRRTTGAVWLVRSDGYRTFGSQCAQLDTQLGRLRCDRVVMQSADGRYLEHEALIRFDPCLGRPPSR